MTSKKLSKSKSAAWGAITAQVFTVVSMLLAIATTPLMIKYLDRDAYGLSVLFFQILGYLALLDFGLSTAVVRELALHQPGEGFGNSQINKIFSTSVIISGGLGFAIMLAVFGLAPFFTGMFDVRAELAKPTFYVCLSLGFVVFTNFVQRGLGAMFFAHHRQALITLPSMFWSVVSVVVTVTLLRFGFGLWSFAYVNVGVAVSNAVVSFVMMRLYYPNLRVRWRYFDKKLLGSLFRFGFFMFLTGLATQVILGTDRIVIGKVVSLAAVAVFSITVRIPEVCLTLLSHVTYHATPALTEIMTHGSAEDVKKTYQRLTLLNVTLSTAACWGMVILNEWFIDLWVGPNFFAGPQVLLLALLVMLQQAVARAGVVMLNAKAVARPVSYVSMIEAAVNISLSIWLGSRIGLPGVLLGTVVASLCTSGWYLPRLLQRHLQLSAADYWLVPFVKPVLVVSLAGAALKLLLVWAKTYLGTGWGAFFATGAAVGAAMLAVVWYGVLRKSFADYVPVRFRPYLV